VLPLEENESLRSFEKRRQALSKIFLLYIYLFISTTFVVLIPTNICSLACYDSITLPPDLFNVLRSGIFQTVEF
jgi:hypothetical protein